VYGYSDAKRPTQIVTLRLRATIAVERPRLNARVTREFAKRRVWVAGRWRNTPSLITDYGSTTLVPPGWTTRVDRAGSLILTARN
jgi:hypothetical protein